MLYVFVSDFASSTFPRTVVIFDVIFDLYTTDENNSAYSAEQIIITYDGVQYIYDKNNVILDEDKNESVST